MFDGLVNDLRFYFEVGGYVMPPLVASTLLLWFAIGYRFAALKRGNVRSVRALIEKYPDGLDHAPRGIIEKALAEGLPLARHGGANLRRLLDDAFWPLQRDVRRFQKLIMVIVAVAPLMGLLGTVVGMIETFDSLADMSLFAQSGGIAGGISQALFTTQMGLAVAIPGLIIGGLLNRRADMIQLELAQIKDLLCARSMAGVAA